MFNFCICRDGDDETMQDNCDSQEIIDDQEEVKESQEEIKDDDEEVKESQEEIKESQEVKKSRTEIIDNQDVTKEETTETIKTGGKTNTRLAVKKDKSDKQTTGKVLAVICS